MRKTFIDCGVREGDGIAAFLGDKNVNFGSYYDCLRERSDQNEFELIGVVSPDFKCLNDTIRRFENHNFTLLEKLVWIYDGQADFDSDGESCDCRIFEISKIEGKEPWRHPNQNATIKPLECIDFSEFLINNFTSKDYIIVKLDIEGAEYDVLKKLIDSGVISLIEELYVEYHWWGNSKLRTDIESYINGQSDIYYRNDLP